MIVDRTLPVELPCLAQGNPTPIYTWIKDGEILRESSNESGTLVFPQIQFNDQGIYQCNATNRLGNERRRKTRTSSRFVCLQARRCRAKFNFVWPIWAIFPFRIQRKPFKFDGVIRSFCPVDHRVASRRQTSSGPTIPTRPIATVISSPILVFNRIPTVRSNVVLLRRISSPFV